VLRVEAKSGTAKVAGGRRESRRTDLGRSAVARYIQLATLFRRRIETGQWAVDAQIPTVDELAAECGVARATIRQALGTLESAGLIVRYRAKGTFVSKQPQSQLWCEVETNLPGLMNSRPGAQIELLSSNKVQRPGFVPHAIGDLVGRYRHLRRRHLRDGVPFLLADVYLDEELYKKLPRSALTSKTAMRLVASAPGVTIVDARQTLTIGSADIETAEYLQVPLNAPVANVSRSAVDQNGNVIMISNGIYRGDVVRLDIKLK
jgi:GntR family transcriptional regulator